MAPLKKLKDVRELLYTAAYYPKEIERVLDPKTPCFLVFDPELGYEQRTHVIRDGDEDTLCSYQYDPRDGYRIMINCAGDPCRINSYGDSYTQCAQVNNGETWQEVLAAHLREPIRNFGVGGYGVYQAYLRALRKEKTKRLAAEYIILNIWDDDHLRNIDAARWIRVAWMCRDLPRGGGPESYPVHGFPWAHLRYDLNRGTFVENPGMCRKAEDLRTLVGKENYYRAFKDDTVAHIYTLSEGGEAPIAEAERLAEAFGLKVNLRSAKTRRADARKLHLTYGMRSTMFIVDRFRRWARQNKRKLMILLSYDVPTVQRYLATGERFDEEFLDFLRREKYLSVDCLSRAGEEFKTFRGTIIEFCSRFYVGRAGAQVFGHYKPYGNFWFAHAVRRDVVTWLKPKPPTYR